MSETKNECEIVNRLSKKVEKELAENMSEINERIDNVAEIDDTVSSLTTTYSSDKINDLISDIPGGNVINDSVVSLDKTFSSKKIVNALMSVLSSKSKYVTINTNIGRATASYATVLTISDLNLSSSSIGAIELNYTVTAGSTHPPKEILITGVKSDNSTYVINDTVVEASSSSTQSAFINVSNVTFEDDTVQILIQFKNTTNDQYSATFYFTGYVNMLTL